MFISAFVSQWAVKSCNREWIETCATLLWNFRLEDSLLYYNTFEYKFRPTISVRKSALSLYACSLFATRVWPRVLVIKHGVKIISCGKIREIWTLRSCCLGVNNNIHCRHVQILLWSEEYLNLTESSAPMYPVLKMKSQVQVKTECLTHWRYRTRFGFFVNKSKELVIVILGFSMAQLSRSKPNVLFEPHSFSISAEVVFLLTRNPLLWFRTLHLEVAVRFIPIRLRKSL